MSKTITSDRCRAIIPGKNIGEALKLNIGEALDALFDLFFKEGYVKDKKLSGHHLLFDLKNGKPLDDDISVEELSSGNYATIDPDGKPVRLNAIVEEGDGTLYAAFGWPSKTLGPEVEEPSLFEKFINWFKSDEKKSPAVKAWNNWNAFLKTAKARGKYVKKNLKAQMPPTDTVTGVSAAEYAQESPQREAQDAEKIKETAAIEKDKAEKQRFRAQFDAALNGEYGTALKNLAETQGRLQEEMINLSFDQEGFLDKNSELFKNSLDEFVRCTVMLKLALGSETIREQIDKSNGDIRQALGSEFFKSLRDVKKKMTDLQVYSDCAQNGGKAIIKEITSIAAGRHNKPSDDEELINLNGAEQDDKELDKSRESSVSFLH